MNTEDMDALATAVRQLEQQSFAVTVANKIGLPLEALMAKLPIQGRMLVERAVHRALQECLRVALTSTERAGLVTPRKRMHTALTAATGAAGGLFGIAGVLVELPVSTTLMLRSVAEIARANGENLRDPEAALSCLEVFGLGRSSGHNEAVESAYFATRAAMAQATREAAAYVTEKGFAKGSAPALVRFISNIATRFGVEVSEKAAAQLAPVIGALGGLSLNVMFTTHFQRLAEGHFTVRRLERRWGADTVRHEYERLRAQLP